MNTGISAISGIFSNVKNFMSLNKWLIIGSIIVFILIAVGFYTYYTSSSKPRYSANNEDGGSSGNPASGQTAELMFFFADWCPHCKTAKPIWQDLKATHKTVNGYTIIFTEVDCSEETPEVEKLMNQYNIEGYPTIKLIKDGQVIEYDAKPTKENLHKFLNTVL